MLFILKFLPAAHPLVALLSYHESIRCSSYKNISDRAVRRLLAAALENIRKPLAVVIQQRLDDKLPVTLEKRRFLEWYEQQQKQIEQKETPGDKPDES